MADTIGTDKAFPSEGNYGLTKREYFAGQIVQGMLASTDRWLNKQGTAKIMADSSVILADVLIDKLNSIGEQ